MTILPGYCEAVCRPILAFLLLTVPALAAEQIGGYTDASHDRAHGTQIEYLSTDGKAYLWYPGNARIVRGKWKRQGDQMCFAYGANTYNPATGQRGGGWECMPFRLWWWVAVVRVKGDPLGIATRDKVPFKLGRERVKFDQLVARVTGGKKPPLEVTVLTPGDEVTLSCKSIMANAERSKSDMAMAASTYFHGIFMGEPCVKVDSARAFDLMARSGTDPAPFLRVLRERAASGNPNAKRALDRYGP